MVWSLYLFYKHSVSIAKMVSMQQDIFPWLDYEADIITHIMDVSHDPLYSSYDTYIPVPRTHTPDPILAWFDIHPNAFMDVYTRYTKSFKATERYTLFIPLKSTLFRYIIEFPRGHSSQDRWARVHIQNEMEEILRRHMVAYRVDPSLLKNQDVQIETLADHTEIDKSGMVDKDPTNHISHCMEYPHATFFFITHERSDRFYH